MSLRERIILWTKRDAAFVAEIGDNQWVRRIIVVPDLTKGTFEDRGESYIVLPPDYMEAMKKGIENTLPDEKTNARNGSLRRERALPDWARIDASTRLPIVYYRKGDATPRDPFSHIPISMDDIKARRAFSARAVHALTVVNHIEAVGARNARSSRTEKMALFVTIGLVVMCILQIATLGVVYVIHKDNQALISAMLHR